MVSGYEEQWFDWHHTFDFTKPTACMGTFHARLQDQKVSDMYRSVQFKKVIMLVIRRFLPAEFGVERTGRGRAGPDGEDEDKEEERGRGKERERKRQQW